MKKAYWVTILFCLAAALMMLPVKASAQSRTASSATDGSSLVSEGMRMMLPYQSYSQYALDMILRYQDKFIGSALNPDEYVVGPGDRFRVSFIASDIGNIECQVNLGGELFIKSVGAVDLQQKTLREAIAAIQQAVDTKYKGSGFTVEMSGFRFVPVHVIGEVASPGIYYAPAPWRVSAVIELAGGLTPEALSRKIVLRGEGKDLPVDLVRFNAVGNEIVDPMVCAGNTIYVPNRKDFTDFVSVSGLVNRPGVFAALKDDRVSDYLAYAGNAAGNLDDMTVTITNPGTGDPTMLDGAKQADMDYLPRPGDNIAVRWKDGAAHRGDVVIFGAVVNPGRYPITSGESTLADLLNACGGFGADGCRDQVQIYRSRRDHTAVAMTPPAYNEQVAADNDGMSRSSRTRLSLDPRRPVDPSELTLADNDSVYVPFATGMITVAGAVASPGLVHYRDGKTVEYYLSEAGGPGFDADKSRMVVFNPATGGEISAADAGQLFDGEVLYVPRKESSEKP